MSRIGKKPIKTVSEVKVEVEGQEITVSGPKGQLSYELPKALLARIEGDGIYIERKEETKSAKSLHGLFHRLISNGIKGVSQGRIKSLELVGTGYRAKMDGRNIVLSIGFSHPVIIEPPEGITLSVEENRINVSGIDKSLVGQTAANIRKIRPPEPYKGKGIRYVGEYVRRKPGKAAKVGVAA